MNFTADVAQMVAGAPRLRSLLLPAKCGTAHDLLLLQAQMAQVCPKVTVR